LPCPFSPLSPPDFNDQIRAKPGPDLLLPCI
jgi:hypothetical protein